MAFNHTLSAILRGIWLVDQQWGDAQMPMVISYLKGENVDFGFKESFKKDPRPQLKTTFQSANKNAAMGRSVFGVGTRSDVRGLPEGSIAVMDIAGPMLKEDEMCGGPGMVSMAAQITQLANAENIAGIILNIDSPGGQASGTALLSNAIKEAGTKKPVISMIDDGMAASAGMWIASSANEVYATQPTDQFGSVGVYTKVADWNKHYKEMLKLDVQDIYAPQSTDKNKDYRDAISGNTTAIEEDLGILADQFINTVQNNRAGKIKGDKWKTGKMFYANDAAKIGLIDGIKSFNQVLSRLDKLINNPKPKNSNMAFTKTISAAKADQLEVVEGGFLVEETHLNNIETALTAAETAAAAAATSLETATASIASLTEQLTAEKATAEALTANEAAANTKISDLEAAMKTAADASATTIAALQAEVTELGKKPSGSGSTTVVLEDGSTEEPHDGVPTLMDAEHPLNQFAATRIAHFKKTKKTK